MRHIPYAPPYDCPGHGFCAAAETGVSCPICGGDIVWWAEAVAEDKDGQICHAECVEKEENT